MRRTCVVMMAVVALLAAGARDAQAQRPSYRGYATGHLGIATGGDLSESSPALGLSVAVVEGSGWGAEMDVGFSDDDSGIHEADLVTFMLNANWISPRGPLRPFLTGGVGTLRLHGCLSSCPGVTTTTDVGLNAGGGAYYRVNDQLGVRGEARYLWAPGEHPNRSRPDNFGFWRASIGVTFMWAIAP